MNTRPIRVESARDLGPLFADNRHEMVGQDGAFSIPLPDGRSLWFFGDTLIGARPPGCPWIIDGKLVDHRDMSGMGPYKRMINNTGLVVPAGGGVLSLARYQYLLDTQNQIRTLIPLREDEDPDWDRIWCQHGVCVGDELLLSFIKVRMLTKNTGPLPIGFEIVGSGLAISSCAAAMAKPVSDEPTFSRLTRNGSDLLWKADEPHFASAFYHDRANGWVYMYGSVERDGKHRAHLARVRDDRLADVESYEYLTSPAPTWGSDVAAAVPVFDEMPSELSVSFNAHLGAFLAVHSLGLTGQIVGRTAPTPWGPWSESTLLWQVKPTALAYTPPYSFRLIYAGKEHPEVSPDGGRTTYLTYIEFEEYMPHLIEVRFG